MVSYFFLQHNRIIIPAQIERKAMYRFQYLFLHILDTNADLDPLWKDFLTMLNMFSFANLLPAILLFSPLPALQNANLLSQGVVVLGCKCHNNTIIIKVYLISASTADVVLKGKYHSIKGSVCSISSKVDLGGLKNMKKVNKNTSRIIVYCYKNFPDELCTVNSSWNIKNTQFKKNIL